MTYMRSCCCGSGITCFFPDGRSGSGTTGTCCYIEPLGNCCVQGYIYPNNPSSGKVYLEKIDCIKELTKSECDSYNILGQQKGTWTLYGAPTTCADPDKAECSETMCGSTYPNEEDPGDDVPPGFCKLYNVDYLYMKDGGDCYPVSPCRYRTIYIETWNEFYFSGGGNDLLNRELDPSIYDRDIFFEEFCDPQFPGESYGKFIYKVKTTYLGLVRVGTKRRGWRWSLRVSYNGPRDGICDAVLFYSDDDSGLEVSCISSFTSDLSSNASAPPPSDTTLEPSAGNPIKSNRHLCDCISDITECDCANKNAESWDAARDPITGYSGKTGGDWIWTESGDCNLTTAGATGIIGCRGACCVSEAGIPTAENPCPDWVGIDCIDNTTQCECDQFTEYGSDGQATKYGDFKGLGTTCGGTDCLPTSPCLQNHTCQNNIIINVAVATTTRKISGQYNCQCAGEGSLRTNTYTEDSEETYWKYNRNAEGCVCNYYFGQNPPFIFYDENTPSECTSNFFNNCVASPNPDTLTFDYGECGSKVITGEVKFQDIGQIIIPPCGLWLKPGTFKKEMIVSSGGCVCPLPPYPYIDYEYRLIETYYFPNVATFYYGCNGTADIPNPWGDASSNNTRIETKTPILC